MDDRTRNSFLWSWRRHGYYGRYARCRNISVDTAIERIKNGEPYVIRFKSEGDFNNKIIFGLRGILSLGDEIINNIANTAKPGWITDEGEFLNGEEALHHAEECDQLTEIAKKTIEKNNIKVENLTNYDDPVEEFLNILKKCANL